MSYTRHYTFGVSGSVRYPASQNGGTVSYHDSVNVTLHVDTSPFDRSVISCSREVNTLTASVANATMKMCNTRKETARLISKSIINGFFGMICSEISQQKAMLASKIPVLLQDLKSRAELCLGKKDQMHRDFERITTRYSDTFRELDANMIAALKQLDQPLFDISNKINTFVFSSIVGREAVFSVVGNIDCIRGNTQITISAMKQSASNLIQVAKRNLQYTKVLNATIEQMLYDENPPQEKMFFLPVLSVEGDAVTECEPYNCTILPKKFVQKEKVYEKISIIGNKQRQQYLNTNQKKSIDYFLMQKISKFAQENSEADNTKRLTDEMVNLWKISQDNIIS